MARRIQGARSWANRIKHHSAFQISLDGSPHGFAHRGADPVRPGAGISPRDRLDEYHVGRNGLSVALPDEANYLFGRNLSVVDPAAVASESSGKVKVAICIYGLLYAGERTAEIGKAKSTGERRTGSDAQLIIE